MLIINYRQKKMTAIDYKEYVLVQTRFVCHTFTFKQNNDKIRVETDFVLSSFPFFSF